MNEIRRVLRAAAWRLALICFMRALVVCVTGVLGAAIVTRLVQQIFRLALPWEQIAWYSAGGAVLGALVWTIVRRADSGSVARRVDDGAQLREAISTALCVAGSDDPWARVTVEAAALRARGVNVRRAVPLQSPRFRPVPLALALTLFVVWLAVPQRTTSAQLAREKQQARIIEAKSQSEELMKKVEASTSKLNLGEAPKDSPDASKIEPKTPEEARVQTLKKLTSIAEKIEQLKNGDKSLKNEAMLNAMKQLKTPGDGPLSEMSKQLAQGNFQKASEELQKALNKMNNGEMSDKDKKAMGEQLAKLAEQLNKLAQNKKDLEKALEKAGLNKELAKDPKALEQALKNAKNLSEEQKKQLSDASKACDQASKSCNGLSGALAKMAAGMGKEGMSKEGMQAGQEMAGQLSELEMISGEMKDADAAMSECKSALSALASFCDGKCEGMGDCNGDGDCDKEGTRPWSNNWSDGLGAGRGGGGRSRGGGAPGEKETAFKANKEKTVAKNTGGPIIGSRMVEGEQIRGDSQAAFAAAVATADQSASDTIENNLIPREYHDAVKHYFGRLKAKAGANKPDANAPPAPPAETATDADSNVKK